MQFFSLNGSKYDSPELIMVVAMVRRRLFLYLATPMIAIQIYREGV
jgi:hypothetical protein